MYKSFYKLEKNPFSMTPDPDFLYLSPMHKKALSYICYGLDRGIDFVQLTGEIGCGKTTLILTMLKNFGSDVSYAYVVDPKLSFPALLRSFMGQLGLEMNGSQEAKDILLAQFHQYLRGQAASTRRVLLIVDEAQNIDPAVLEELRMLSNLDTGSYRPMQMLLVGQAEFRSLLNNPVLAALRQRITVAAHLSPLDIQETERYIRHRLKLAGANDTPIFTPRAINKIFAFSGGIPRLVNLACESSLLAGYVEEKPRLDEHLVGSVIKELEDDLKAPAPVSSRVSAPKEVPTERVSKAAVSVTIDEADLQNRKGVKETKKVKKLNAAFKSKKLKIAILSAIGSVCSIGFSLLAYYLSR